LELALDLSSISSSSSDDDDDAASLDDEALKASDFNEDLRVTPPRAVTTRKTQ